MYAKPPCEGVKHGVCGTYIAPRSAGREIRIVGVSRGRMRFIQFSNEIAGRPHHRRSEKVLAHVDGHNNGDGDSATKRKVRTTTFCGVI